MFSKGNSRGVAECGGRGVVAAGHADSARAGAVILEAGGNAVDAAVATALAACVAEPFLIALGAGGFMLVHDEKSGKQTLFDFFISMPGQGLEQSQRAELVPTPVDFGETTQMFHGGHASVGVPGFVAGIFEAHERYGSLPFKELIIPAKDLAKNGVTLTKQQGFLVEILGNIMKLSPDAEKLFFPNGTALRESDSFRHPDIITTLDELASHGAESFYRGELADQIVAELDRHGGYVTSTDMADYRVIERKPVSMDYRNHTILTNPPPSSGGALLTHTLHLLSRKDLSQIGWHSYDHLKFLIEAMASTNAVRRALFNDRVHEEDVLDGLLAEEMLQTDHQDLVSRLAAQKPGSNWLGNTTHISVMDGQGNAVSMTCSNGSGSGIAVPGTGILLNNILGEEDLNPAGFHQSPIGQRLTSMMSPTIVLRDGRPDLVLGSAGSNRIRSAILQVVSNVLDYRLSIAEAVEAPRLHVEAADVELEGGVPATVSKRLTREGYPIHQWKERNLFFGGVQAVGMHDGTFSGAGDARRGGVAVVV